MTGTAENDIPRRKHEVTTAILVDGGFYRRRAVYHWGYKEPQDRADELFHLEQKGVDMRIGIDISSLAIRRQVDQIILISGDSDFVPAAKHARREGVDFILAPMGATIKPDLFEHIDGLINKPYKKALKAGVPAG